jgi:hypothetical protein
VLNGQLALHDIRDTEAFCITIIQRSRLELGHHDQQDLLAYLVEEAWILSRTWRPGPSPFSTHAGQWLPRRIIDWQRQRQDTRYPSNTRFAEVSIDDRMAQPHTLSMVDDHLHRDPDHERLHRTRDRSEDRPYPNLGQRPTRTAA